MIAYEDQMQLFRLISKKLKGDITCFAFGGTAMMFYGYKDTTKDIDLLFESGLNHFISVIESLGFRETGPDMVFAKKEKLPRMFSRSDYRLDLFAKKVFRAGLSPRMKEDFYAVHEFRKQHTLKVKVLRKEHIVFLKSKTERRNDLDDIKNIVSKEKEFDWQYLIDETIWQHENGDQWAVIDVERTLQALKDMVFIEKRYFDQLYKAQG